MQALSMHQPWASLVAKQVKHIETRDRRPPSRLIGQRIAIHATKQIVTINPDAAANPTYRLLIVRFNQAVTQVLGAGWTTELPTGAVIATAVLDSASQVNTHDDLPADPRERLFGEYSTDRWMWLLTDVRELAQPVPARGYPSFWSWSPTEEQYPC